MGTQDQSSGNKPNQINQPGQNQPGQNQPGQNQPGHKGTPGSQQEQRKDRENQPGGHEKGSGQQGSEGMRKDR